MTSASPGDGDTDMRALAGLSFRRWLLVLGGWAAVCCVGASPHVEPPRSGLGRSGNYPGPFLGWRVCDFETLTRGRSSCGRCRLSRTHRLWC